MRKPALILTGLAAFAVGGMLACVLSAWALRASPSANATHHPAWQAVAWPFPMDQWGKGQAFRCNAADCGAEVMVYLRTKVGFCNCTSGMTDDADIDRVSDIGLFGGPLYAQAPGQPVKAAWMKGRSRPFAVRTQQGDATAISIGLHDNCDAVVATAIFGRGKLAAIEPAVLNFLNSKAFVQWAQVALGL
jgi:hypothetical protein